MKLIHRSFLLAIACSATLGCDLESKSVTATAGDADALEESTSSRPGSDTGVATTGSVTTGEGSSSPTTETTSATDTDQDASGEGTGGVFVRPELEDCGGSPLREVPWETPADLYAQLTGAWLLCPDYLVERPTLPPEIVGIEFRDDDTFIYLLEDEDGDLVRGRGIDYTGAWHPGTVDNNPATIIVVPEGSGMSYYRPQFTAEPRQLRIDEAWGIFPAHRYVPVTLGE